MFGKKQEPKKPSTEFLLCPYCENKIRLNEQSNQDYYEETVEILDYGDHFFAGCPKCKKILPMSNWV